MTNNSKTVEQFFEITTVPPCGSVNLAIEARCDFFLTRLIIPHDAAGHFLVTDLKCGRDSRLISRGAIPAGCFSDRAFSEDLSLGEVKKGDSIVISVTNQSSVDRNFSCSILGEQETTGTEVERRILGYGSTLIPEYGWANIHVQSQVTFRPYRLIVPSTIAHHFKIESVYYGEEVRQELPLGLIGHRRHTEMTTAFLDLESRRLRLPAKPNQFITISVQNVADCSRNFQAALVGYVGA